MVEPLVFETTMQVAPPNIPITLKFTPAGGGPPIEHHFEALGDPGAGGDFALVAGMVTLPDGRSGADLNAIRRALRRVLLPDSYERLEALLDDQTLTVPTVMIGDVYRGLMDRYAARPTEPPSSS